MSETERRLVQEGPEEGPHDCRQGTSPLDLSFLYTYGMKDGLGLKVGDWRLCNAISKDSCYGDLQVGRIHLVQATDHALPRSRTLKSPHPQAENEQCLFWEQNYQVGVRDEWCWRFNLGLKGISPFSILKIKTLCQISTGQRQEGFANSETQRPAVDSRHCVEP